jgi:uncharacterized protein
VVMLSLKPACERCGAALPPDSQAARICSFECSFCADCTDGPLGGQCPNCGGELLRRPVRPADVLLRFPPGLPLLDDLAAAAFVQTLDAAWLGRDWERLERLLAPEVVYMMPGLSGTLRGRAAALASYMEFMRDAQVHEYNATDIESEVLGAVALLSYRWQMDWSKGEENFRATGRDVCVLEPAGGDWRILWRTQLPA